MTPEYEQATREAFQRLGRSDEEFRAFIKSRNAKPDAPPPWDEARARRELDKYDVDAGALEWAIDEIDRLRTAAAAKGTRCADCGTTATVVVQYDSVSKPHTVLCCSRCAPFRSADAHYELGACLYRRTPGT